MSDFNREKIADALDYIRAQEKRLEERATAAGLPCGISIMRRVGGLSIRISTYDQLSFKEPGHRPVSWAHVRDLDQFDKVVSAAVAYRQEKAKRA